jgi:hypothetical protein
MTTQPYNPTSTPTPETNREAVKIALLFNPGRVVATPGALQAMEDNHILSLDLLSRHLTGDFGELPEEDAAANQQALQDGSRLLSSYPLASGARIWLITEADRSITTFLLPEEY